MFLFGDRHPSVGAFGLGRDGQPPRGRAIGPAETRIPVVRPPRDQTSCRLFTPTRLVA